MNANEKKSGAEILELLKKLPEAREQIVTAHLLTPEQAGWLEHVGLTVAHLLTGYYSEDVAEEVKATIAAWDEVLGESFLSDTTVDPALVSAMSEIDKKESAKIAETKLSDKDKKLKQGLQNVVDKFHGADGKDYPVTALNVQSHSWRRFAVEVVRLFDPETYAKYRDMKYKGGSNPDLKTRQEAYKFIICRFLEISYTVPGL